MHFLLPAPILHSAHRTFMAKSLSYRHWCDRTEKRFSKYIPESLMYTVKKIWYVFDLHLPMILGAIGVAHYSVWMGYLAKERVKGWIIPVMMVYVMDMVVLSDLYPYDYITNLVEKCLKEGLSHSVYDHKTYEKMAQLYREGSNKFIWTGPAGSGKTKRMEGLAALIASNQCPEVFKNLPVFELDLENLHGRTVPGLGAGIEEKLAKAITESLLYGKVILFIDEFHKIVDSGNKRISIANLLEKVPARLLKNLILVGATTKKEFRERIERNSAFSDYKEIEIPRYKDSELVEILIGRFRGLTREVATYALEQMHEYFPQRSLPAGVITLIEDIKVNTMKPNAEITTRDVKVAVRRIKNHDFQEAENVDGREIAKAFKTFKTNVKAYEKSWKGSRFKFFPRTITKIKRIIRSI